MAAYISPELRPVSVRFNPHYYYTHIIGTKAPGVTKTCRVNLMSTTVENQRGAFQRT